jgi:MSHA biogenesis protein MshM
MYLRYFGLKEAPFNLTPDTAFFFGNPSHREALNTLLAALQMGEGFIKVTGEIGTGKTLLCRKLLRELGDIDGFVTAYIPNPALTANALRYALADELRLDYHPNIGQHRLVKLINRRLVDHRVKRRKVVLIIDEAQALPGDCLEALRLLTNLETEKTKLLQVVLFGQPELDAHLARPAVRQLLQRITFTYALQPMDSRAVAAYLTHRLAVAGYRGPVLFAPGAVRAIARISGGIPRLINILAHKCLLAAYGEGRSVVTRRHLRRAIDDTESVRQRHLLVAVRRATVVAAGAFSAGAAAVSAYLLMGQG